MPAQNSKKHILLNGYSASEEYRYPKGSGGSFDVIQRNRNTHGNRILRQLERIRDEFDIPDEVAVPEGIVKDDAVYVEFVSEWGYELKFESLHQDISDPLFQILNIRKKQREDDPQQIQYHVTVMMREGGVSKFIQKVEQYLDPNKDTRSHNPANAPLINNISEIRKATLQAFWTDAPEISFPVESQVVWWEVWFLRTGNEEIKLKRVLENLEVIGVEIGASELIFAEHRVRLVRGTALQLSQSILLLDNLAELRKPQETADFICYKDDNYYERKEWLEDLERRTQNLSNDDSVIVCLLDSGVNNIHPLIAPFLPDTRLYSYNSAWGVNDSYPNGGHGTGVAVLALYGDLVDVMAASHQIQILHQLESVKIFQPTSHTPPELYGSVTEDAIYQTIADRPRNPRVYCLTIMAADGAFNGRPSTWSAAIDKIAFGSIFEPPYPQLFIVSGGNVEINKPTEYPDYNHLESIHDPGQAYNALTVGAYTRKDRIEPTSGYVHLAQNGAMAPCNSTSITWDHQWPLKPDIVMEGGNLAHNNHFTVHHHSLRLLTADKDFPKDYFLLFGDTSGATGLAAKMAAEIRASYPNYWPETIRALMVHSANWTTAMLNNQQLKDLRERDYINLLRSVGYGVPIQERAINSAANSLTLIAEKEIQPYKLIGSTVQYNEYHLFNLPWPADVLREALFDQDVKLTITLSYFIEPNPGSRRYATNFHYHSHGLDFAVIKPGEKLSVFRRRISAATEIPADERNGKGEKWMIGPRIRSRGSVKKDFITMSGADMAVRNTIAVFPKNGWFKTRKKLGKAESKVRYSLIITLETPNTEVDIYTPVLTLIETPISIQV